MDNHVAKPASSRQGVCGSVPLISLDKRWLDSVKVSRLRTTASCTSQEVSKRERSAFVYSRMRDRQSRMCASSTHRVKDPNTRDSAAACQGQQFGTAGFDQRVHGRHCSHPVPAGTRCRALRHVGNLGRLLSGGRAHSCFGQRRLIESRRSRPDARTAEVGAAVLLTSRASSARAGRAHQCIPGRSLAARLKAPRWHGSTTPAFASDLRTIAKSVRSHASIAKASAPPQRAGFPDDKTRRLTSRASPIMVQRYAISDAGGARKVEGVSDLRR